MAHTLPTSSASVPVRTSDSPRLPSLTPRPAKAPGVPFRVVMKEAILRYYGSVKATAIELQVDPSLMQREFERGMFERFDAHASDDAKAFVSYALNEVYGPHDAKGRAQQLVKQCRAMLDELAQYVEYIA